MRTRLLVGLVCGAFLLSAAACSDDDCDCSNACPKSDGAVAQKDKGGPPKDGPAGKKDSGKKDGPVVKPDSGPPPVTMPKNVYYASAYDKAGKAVGKWHMYSAKTSDGSGVVDLLTISATAQVPSHIVLSPGAKYVAFNLNKALAVGDLTTKKVQANVKAYNSFGWAKAWARDEARLIVRYQGVRVLDMPDGWLFAEQVEKTKTDDDRAAISFDNKLVGYVGKDDKGNRTLVIKDAQLKKEEAAAAVGLDSAGWVYATTKGFIVTSHKGWHSFDFKGKQLATVDLPADPAPVNIEAIWPRPNPEGTHVLAWVKPKTPANPNKPYQIRRYAVDGQSYYKVANVSYTAATSDYCVNEQADVVYIMENGWVPMLYAADGQKVALPKTQFRYAKCAGLY